MSTRPTSVTIADVAVAKSPVLVPVGPWTLEIGSCTAPSSTHRTVWSAAAVHAVEVLLEDRTDVRAGLDEVLDTLRVLERADVLVLFADDGAGLVELSSVAGPDLPRGTREATIVPAGEALEGLVGPNVVAPQVLGWEVARAAVVLPEVDHPPGVVLAVGWLHEPERRGHLDRRTTVEFLDHVRAAHRQAGRLRTRVEHAVAQDRLRIARDLHDHVIQRLFAVGMSLQAATAAPGAGDAVDRAVDSLDATIRDLRRVIFSLQERQTDPDGRADLDHLLGDAGAALGFSPSLVVHGRLSTLSDVLRRETTAVVRESLSNVARHARARQASVEISVVDGVSLAVTVTDDGAGMPDSSSGASSGIANVRERARVLGGWASVRAGARGGTEVRWFVPLPRIRPGPAGPR
jgi:signal transduction histidine kinase